ncbi:MAG TPA: hypothetical protein VIG24_07535 [Acidimicrobiia bacterium]
MTEQTLLWIALLAVTGVLACAVRWGWWARHRIADLELHLAIEEEYRWPKPGVHCHSMLCFDSEGKCECQCGYSDRLAEVAR